MSDMPEITSQQKIGLVVGGIPIIAEMLRAFGVYDLSIEQQDALSNAVTWGVVLAGALFGGDAILRTGRNLRKGQVESAVVEQRPDNGDQLAVVQESMSPMAVTIAPPANTPPTGTTYQKPTGFEP